MRGMETVYTRDEEGNQTYEFQRPIMERGDWLFTCRMEPAQFGEWDKNDPLFFETLEGSGHDVQHCSLTPISDKYAAWFLKHQIWRMLDFFRESVVLRNSTWRKFRATAYRVAVNGVEFHYNRKLGGRVLFSHIELGDFAFYPSDDLRFDLCGESKAAYRTRFAVYEAYVRWRAEQDGLVYEGY
jgi:hypothetical protein